jgi:hypothetical protein
MKRLPAALVALAVVVAGPALADKGGKGKGGKHEGPSAAEHAPGKNGHGQPKFSGGERDHIVAYFNANPSARQQLPPGLAKQNKIPPGWQKKIAPGQRIPDDIWVHRVPLPHEILVQLPPPPPGVIHVRIHDHVLKVVEKTHEVLDDIGLPHPPTPGR